MNGRTPGKSRDSETAATASPQSAPPMPTGFNDRSAWDAIHWQFSEDGSLLDEAVIGWQRDNQERVRAAMEAESHV